jgi:hypothetical protein
MEDLFKSFMEKIFKFRHHLENVKIGYEKIIIDLIIDLKKMNNKPIEESERLDFINKNLGNLYKIHDTTLGYFAKYHLSGDDIDKFRSSHNIFFNKTIKIKNFEKFIKQLPTKIFTEF